MLELIVAIRYFD